MPSNSALAAKRTAPLFAALGDETRLRLVSHLSNGEPMSITRLTDTAKVTRQAITKHLHILEGVGLVRGVRHGREQLWELTPGKFEEAHRCLDLISEQWDRALERLRKFVEE
jgi:DNA-binding transcriptional ArsR family regulator